MESLLTIGSFESGLKLGDSVRIRWTNCNCYYSAKATISKINAKSLKAKLDEEVPCSYGEPYSIGREIMVPRLLPVTTWSVNNRVEPVDGY